MKILDQRGSIYIWGGCGLRVFQVLRVFGSDYVYNLEEMIIIFLWDEYKLIFVQYFYFRKELGVEERS